MLTHPPIIKLKPPLPPLPPQHKPPPHPPKHIPHALTRPRRRPKMRRPARVEVREVGLHHPFVRWGRGRGGGGGAGEAGRRLRGLGFTGPLGVGFEEALPLTPLTALALVGAASGTSNESTLLPAPSRATAVVGGANPNAANPPFPFPLLLPLPLPLRFNNAAPSGKCCGYGRGERADEEGPASTVPFVVVSIGGGGGGEADLDLSPDVVVVVVAADESRECQAPGVRLGGGEGEDERGKESVEEWVEEAEEAEEKRAGVMVASEVLRWLGDPLALPLPFACNREASAVGRPLPSACGYSAPALVWELEWEWEFEFGLELEFKVEFECKVESESSRPCPLADAYDSRNDDCAE
ncbi:hypothetical protein B0H13DRAFT_2580746 [Mycena leptocephala]|nr:hypothetical protein B0H13DRAFT_2580746 [Mycena leptocephala]